MFKIHSFLVFSLYFFITFEVTTGIQYKCFISDEGTKCSIYGLNLTRDDDFHIEPVAEHLENVTEIILHGTVPILNGNEICTAIPNLKKFRAHETSVEEIYQDAFEECKELSTLDLQFNNFKKLDIHAFRGLKNLQKLWLRGGNLTTIDLDLSDLKNLISLALNDLNLTVFPVEILRGKEKLTSLGIFYNNLFDLDIETILSLVPNLEKIHINENNFKCNRLEEILEFLYVKGVEWNKRDVIPKNRHYTPERVDVVICLTDEQWEFERSNLSGEQPIQDLADLGGLVAANIVIPF